MNPASSELHPVPVTMWCGDVENQVCRERGHDARRPPAAPSTHTKIIEIMMITMSIRMLTQLLLYTVHSCTAVYIRYLRKVSVTAQIWITVTSTDSDVSTAPYSHVHCVLVIILPTPTDTRKAGGAGHCTNTTYWSICQISIATDIFPSNGCLSVVYLSLVKLCPPHVISTAALSCTPARCLHDVHR